MRKPPYEIKSFKVTRVTKNDVAGDVVYVRDGKTLSAKLLWIAIGESFFLTLPDPKASADVELAMTCQKQLLKKCRDALKRGKP